MIVDIYQTGLTALANMPVEGVQFAVPATDDRAVSATKPGQIYLPSNVGNPDLVAAANVNLTAL